MELAEVRGPSSGVSKRERSKGGKENVNYQPLRLTPMKVVIEE
jgi:hypothetical protein